MPLEISLILENFEVRQPHGMKIIGKIINFISTPFQRNGVSRAAKLWPNARIPYAISPHYSPHERALLAKAVKQVFNFI